MTGNNIEPLQNAIKEGIDEIEQLKKERTSVNAKMKAVRERLEAKGCPKDVLAMGLKYLGWDKAKREAFDETFEIILDVVKDNYEPDLLD